MNKDYFSLDELALRWNMRVVDLLHQAIGGRIKVGVYLYGAELYGLNSAMRVVGYYTVTGIVTVRLVDPNEFCHPGLTARFGAFFADPEFPPEVSEVSSYTDEASCPRPFFRWAPGHDWDHPETDLSKIDRYTVGQVTDERGVDTFDLRYYRRDELVVHPIEVARIDRQLGIIVDQAPDIPRPQPKASKDQRPPSPAKVGPRCKPWNTLATDLAVQLVAQGMPIKAAISDAIAQAQQKYPGATIREETIERNERQRRNNQ